MQFRQGYEFSPAANRGRVSGGPTGPTGPSSPAIQLGPFNSHDLRYAAALTILKNDVRNNIAHSEKPVVLFKVTTPLAMRRELTT
jgi:hypothetical protein